MTRKNVLVTTALSLAIGIASACGGDENPPASEVGHSKAMESEGGEHTMPDGTKMSGHSHEDATQHTMPDGTTMEDTE